MERMKPKHVREFQSNPEISSIQLFIIYSVYDVYRSGECTTHLGLKLNANERGGAMRITYRDSRMQSDQLTTCHPYKYKLDRSLNQTHERHHERSQLVDS